MDRDRRTTLRILTHLPFQWEPLTTPGGMADLAQSWGLDLSPVARKRLARFVISSQEAAPRRGASE